MCEKSLVELNNVIKNEETKKQSVREQGLKYEQDGRKEEVQFTG